MPGQIRLFHDKCGIYCKAFANVKKHCTNRGETLVDMCRVMSKPVFWDVDHSVQNKFGAKNICLDIYITFLFTHTVAVPCI